MSPSDTGGRRLATATALELNLEEDNDDNDEDEDDIEPNRLTLSPMRLASWEPGNKDRQRFVGEVHLECSVLFQICRVSVGSLGSVVKLLANGSPSTSTPVCLLPSHS